LIFQAKCCLKRGAECLTPGYKAHGARGRVVSAAMSNYILLYLIIQTDNFCTILLKGCDMLNFFIRKFGLGEEGIIGGPIGALYIILPIAQIVILFVILLQITYKMHAFELIIWQ